MPAFQIGYCLNCGAQSQVRDAKGRPVMGLPGTRVCWICICDENDIVKTRVGHITLCYICTPMSVNIGTLLENLAANPASGVSGNEVEWSMFPKRRIEVIKTYEGTPQDNRSVPNA